MCCVATVQGCVADKDVDVLPRSATLDDDNRRPRDEPEEIQSARGRERTRTPATVAEPDSTMSNDTGDHTMPVEAEPTESRDVADERNRTESIRHHMPNTVAGEIMSSGGGDAVDDFRSRFRWERVSGFDSARAAGRRSGSSTKQLGDTASGAGSTDISQNTDEESAVRSTWRKRQWTEFEARGPTTDQQPAEGLRKKHRPDPLVLSSSSAEHYGYPSWLRSPRSVWNGAGPVPYTPPPMLSPARRAPGLFWTAAAAHTQPLWSLFRQPSAFTCECFYCNTACYYRVKKYVRLSGVSLCLPVCIMTDLSQHIYCCLSICCICVG